uniref:Uncharacterized protein n=1 Tax=Anguilla anguilla TaxID=7936 RepID=A0A0E9P8F3_ANGAN
MSEVECECCSVLRELAQAREGCCSVPRE